MRTFNDTVSNYIDQNKKNFLYRSIIKLQFNYCPLVWMFCSRQYNSSKSKLQKEL